MAKKKAAERKHTAGNQKGKIQVRVSDFDHGLRVFEHVQLIRIRSSEYTLLIMEDYFPCLGRVSGTVELVQEDGLTDLGEVRGFYVHRKNEFSLIIENQISPEKQQEDTETDQGGTEDEQ